MGGALHRHRLGLPHPLDRLGVRGLADVVHKLLDVKGALASRTLRTAVASAENHARSQMFGSGSCPGCVMILRCGKTHAALTLSRFTRVCAFVECC